MLSNCLLRLDVFGSSVLKGEAWATLTNPFEASRDRALYLPNEFPFQSSHMSTHSRKYPELMHRRG
jgi:hypothetical protein